jgi:hypothetical protein
MRKVLVAALIVPEMGDTEKQHLVDGSMLG